MGLNFPKILLTAPNVTGHYSALNRQSRITKFNPGRPTVVSGLTSSGASRRIRAKQLAKTSSLFITLVSFFILIFNQIFMAQNLLAAVTAVFRGISTE